MLLKEVQVLSLSVAYFFNTYFFNKFRYSDKFERLKGRKMKLEKNEEGKSKIPD